MYKYDFAILYWKPRHASPPTEQYYVNQNCTVCIVYYSIQYPTTPLLQASTDSSTTIEEDDVKGNYSEAVNTLLFINILTIAFLYFKWKILKLGMGSFFLSFSFSLLITNYSYNMYVHCTVCIYKNSYICIHIYLYSIIFLASILSGGHLFLLFINYPSFF